MKLWLLALAALAIGCKKAPPASSSEADPKPPPAPVDAAVAVTVTPDAAPAVDCSEVLGEIRPKVSSAYIAKETNGPYRKAVELWPGVPEPCRNGEWYVFAAKLLAYAGGTRGKLEANGVVLESRDQALAKAVTYPLKARDLTYVALTAAAGGATKLPTDACAVAEAEKKDDDAHYICGHASLAAGDPAAAKVRFEAIEVPGLYADLDLRRAEAELALGNKKAAKKLAKRASALKHYDARTRFFSSADWETVVAAAKALAK
jgi:hypothetical protein